MKSTYLLLLIFLIALSANAQLDRSTTTVKAPGELLAPKTASPSLLKKPVTPSLSKTRDPFQNLGPQRNLGEPEKEPFSMRTDNGLMTYKLDHFTPKAFKDKEVLPQYANDQYLGDFKTTGAYVELYCRDHEFVDGDKVKISINGVVVKNVVDLDGTLSPVFVKLNSGLNSIEFEALNQGSSGPNTAELRVYDATGQEVTRKEWNLLTGAKANLIVVKQ